jgi:hypothetical protein
MILYFGNFQAYVTLIKDIITGLSALVVAIIAILGLQTWKKQLKGNTEYEIAQRLLRAIYKVREALAWVRNPYQHPSEITQAMEDYAIEGDPIDDPVIKARTEWALYNNRWTKVREAFIECETVALEAEAIWGPIVKENLKPIQDCAAKLFANIESYIREIEYPSRNYDASLQNERFKIIYGIQEDETNFFTIDITVAINKMEEFLKPRLVI